MAVLANLDWALKLATTIYNYIIYMEDHYEDKFEKFIYPALYDAPYEDYKKGKGIFARIRSWLRHLKGQDDTDDEHTFLELAKITGMPATEIRDIILTLRVRLSGNEKTDDKTLQQLIDKMDSINKAL